MIYEHVSPKKELEHIVKSFWMINSDGDMSVQAQKIIPDGYPELIFHYGDPYRININGSWETQEHTILAGQIRNYFFLENTGESKMFAIKFQPWALRELFNTDVSLITDKVIKIPREMDTVLQMVKQIAISTSSFEEKVQQVENWFEQFVQDKNLSEKYKIVQNLIDKKGSVSLKQIQEEYRISERTLERYFKSHVGLSPKFYARIIRFSYIFQLVQEEEIDWTDIVFRAGYYDQSHFSKNFKEFTGEDPSAYGFTEKNMANFFLKS